MKRVFVFKKLMLLISAFVMVFLTACGGGGGTAQSNAGNTAAGGKKTLTFWYIDPGEKEKVYQEAVKRFEAKHPDVDVKMLQIPNDSYKQKFAVAMSGGNPPDIFHSWGGGWLKQFADSGKVLDITGKVDTGNYIKNAIDNATFNGKVYGVPLGLSVTTVFYNKDIFAKYNLQPPKTWDEFLNVIDTLRKNNVIPIALANQPKWTGDYFFVLNSDRIGGPDLFNGAFHRTGKTFDDPQYVQAGQLIVDLVKHNAFNPGFNGLPYDAGSSRQLMYTGQAAMLVMSNAFVNNVRQEAPDFEKKLGAFPYPAVPGGKGDPSDINATSSPMWSASASTKYPDLAIELLKELTSTQTATDYANRTGSVVAVNGVQSSDPWVKMFADQAAKAKYIQWPYDQTLPPELAQTHLDATQAIFGLSQTPEQAVKQVEEKAKTTLKK